MPDQQSIKNNTCPIVDFDHHSLVFSKNRFEILRNLRETTPVAFTHSHGGYWVVTSYQSAKTVLENPEIFSSEKKPDGSGGVTIPSVGPRLMPAETDPPLHSQLRKLISPYYSPKALQQMTHVVDDIVVTLVDNIIAKGEFDIVEDISEILPPLLGLRHMGFPEDRRSTMVTAVMTALTTGTPEEEAALAFSQACGEMMQFVQHKREHLANDVISALIKSDDPVLSDEDIMWFGITLFVGGFKNPGAHISNVLLHLGKDTELRQQLINNRNLIPKANDEFLRYYTAGNSVARNVTTDTTLDGVTLKAGDRVLVLLPSANHDNSVFPDGGLFDLDRKSGSRHLALGGGPHFCVGFNLANMMFIRLLNEIFDRLPNYKVYPEQAVRVADAGIQAGYTTIPASVN